MQQSIPSASKLASGLAPDPQRVIIMKIEKLKNPISYAAAFLIILIAGFILGYQSHLRICTENPTVMREIIAESLYQHNLYKDLVSGDNEKVKQEIKSILDRNIEILTKYKEYGMVQNKDDLMILEKLLKYQESVK